MPLFLITLVSIYFVIQNINSQSPVASPGCGTTPPANNGDTTSFELLYDSIIRIYVVHQPINYNLNQPLPLIFAFHGYTGTAQGMANGFNMDSSSDDNNYLSVYVQSTTFQNPTNPNQGINSWNDIGCSSSPGPDGPTCNPLTVQSVPIPLGCEDTDGNECNWCNCYANDVGFIDYLAQYLENVYCIDMSREYALGYSQGGMMAQRVGCELNSRFAAIAPFHGQEQIG